MTETLSQEDAVRRFEDLHKTWSSKSLASRQMIEQFASFYKDVRIADTSLEEDGDMLLLEWGTDSPLKVDGFADLRDDDDDDEDEDLFEEDELTSLSIKRQICVSSDDDEQAEFDDTAIGLSLSLFFDPAAGDEPEENEWVANPLELEPKLNAALNDRFVASLADRKPARINCIVDNVG